MKQLYAVIASSSYDSRDTEYRKIVFVTENKETAIKFVVEMNEARTSCYSDSYEWEEVEVRY